MAPGRPAGTPPPKKGAPPISRALILLQIALLVSTLIVAISATSSQADLLDAASRTANAGLATGRRGGLDRGIATAYLRVLQGIDSTLPGGRANQLGSSHHRAILDAVAAYYDSVGAGVLASLGRDLGPEEARRAADALSLDSRQAVEQALGAAFPDSDAVNRLATAVIVNCR